MAAFENFVMEKVHEGCSILSPYPPTNADFAAWRKAKGR